MMSSRRWRMWTALPLIGALAGLVGCAGEDGSREPESAEESAQALSQRSEAEGRDEADGPRGHHARRGPGGPEMLLVVALHELELTPAQEAAIEGALDKAAAGRKERGPKDGAPFAALAEGVRAGKIDPAAILAKQGGPGPEAEEHRAAVAGALRTLHATLTKEQRRALVDTLASRKVVRGPMSVRGPMGERGVMGEERGLKAEHGPMGERGPTGERPGKERGPGSGGERAVRGGPLGHLLAGLDLSDAQRESIDRALEAQAPAAADHEAMKQHVVVHGADMRARLEAFAADTFDANAFVAPPEGAPERGPAPHLERMAKDLAAVVPLLEPDQREALAALLEKGPPSMGRPGGPPGPREHGSRRAPAR